MSEELYVKGRCVRMERKVEEGGEVWMSEKVRRTNDGGGKLLVSR